MKVGRICDSCGFHNSLSSLFCENPDCGEDISYLPPVNLEEVEEESAAAVEEAGEVMVPEDGVQTGSGAMDTVVPGDGAQAGSGAMESPMAKTIRMSGISLVNTASGFEVVIPPEGGILGRSGTIERDHFQNSPYVSNEHARVQLSANGGYVIVDLESTNGTKVNGSKIVSGREYPIPAGTRVTLANLEYVVKEL